MHLLYLIFQIIHKYLLFYELVLVKIDLYVAEIIMHKIRNLC